MNNVILEPLRANQITEPGYYLCLPVQAIFEPQLWLVRVYDSEGILCYVTPTDDTERALNGCGHTFFHSPEIAF